MWLWLDDDRVSVKSQLNGPVIRISTNAHMRKTNPARNTDLNQDNLDQM